MAVCGLPWCDGPKLVRYGLSEDEKMTQARQLNLARRQRGREAPEDHGNVVEVSFRG
jgi:hypothetical protein